MRPRCVKHSMKYKKTNDDESGDLRESMRVLVFLLRLAVVGIIIYIMADKGEMHK
jgi:hypothetical protein